MLLQKGHKAYTWIALFVIVLLAGYSIFRKYQIGHNHAITQDSLPYIQVIQKQIDSCNALQKEIEVKKDYFQYKIDSLKRNGEKITLPPLDSLF